MICRLARRLAESSTYVDFFMGLPAVLLHSEYAKWVTRLCRLDPGASVAIRGFLAMAKVPVVRYAFRGNIRNAVTQALNSLQKIKTYNESLSPGSGLPLAYPAAFETYASQLVVYLAGDLTSQYPPAQWPA